MQKSGVNGGLRQKGPQIADLPPNRTILLLFASFDRLDLGIKSPDVCLSTAVDPSTVKFASFAPSAFLPSIFGHAFLASKSPVQQTCSLTDYKGCGQMAIK